MPFTDPDIRAILRQDLSARGRIVEEAGHFGGFADLLLPAELHAFEIKGASDDLRRLPRQAFTLERTYPRVTLVTTSNHESAVERLLGPHWGLWVISVEDGRVSIGRRREASAHHARSALWALAALRLNELRRIADANRLARSGTRGAITKRLLRSVGPASCLAMANVFLADYERWASRGTQKSIMVPQEQPALFPLPFK